MPKPHWQRRVLQEVVAVARQGWLIPQRPGRLRQHADAEHLVVFIHGFFASSGVFRPMAVALAHEGLAPRQVHFDYAPIGSIEGNARRLAKVIEEARVPGPVTVIAHSLGGLIARHAIQHLGVRVDALVTLGTPHHGTPHARPWPLRLAKELSPGSLPLTSLAATRHRLEATEVTSIVASSDVLVHADSSALDGSRVVHIDGVGHHGVLYDPRAWEAVREAIRSAVRRGAGAAVEAPPAPNVTDRAG